MKQTHKNARQWSADDDRLLGEMIGGGKTRRHMAEHFGVNIAQIGGRAYRLGLTKPNGRRGKPKKKVAVE